MSNDCNEPPRENPICEEMAFWDRLVADSKMRGLLEDEPAPADQPRLAVDACLAQWKRD
ncbi:hypothetical protein [Teichococcus oryzae]|uniref:hypothetical protein n=1 Tax=Teichococcus oryzae TaxID=1608942 RepID=UPI0013754ED2|nr:hypothetical protein [Pseudoroseomonas oryzae]